MKNIFILFFSLSFFFSSFAVKADTSWKEIRTVVFTPEKDRKRICFNRIRELHKPYRSDKVRFQPGSFCVL